MNLAHLTDHPFCILMILFVIGLILIRLWRTPECDCNQCKRKEDNPLEEDDLIDEGCKDCNCNCANKD